MPKLYSEDFRRQVLKCLERGKSHEEVCDFFEIGIATLYRWLSLDRKHGSVSPSFKSTYATRKVSQERLLEELEKTPDATLSELAERLGCCFQNVDYWFRKLGITRKKNHSLRRTR